MTALFTSVAVEQPPRSDLRARPSFKRHARPFPAPEPLPTRQALALTLDGQSFRNQVREGLPTARD